MRPGKALVWLSGAQADVLERAPGDRAKYQGIGGAVATTATLAAVSMFFALRMAVDAPWWGALPVAVIWFFAILNLDRWLVVSIQRGQRALLVAVPRLLMALLFGFIISTPLVLQIFQPEVEAEINKIRLEQTESFQGTLTNGETGKKIKDLETREAALLRTIASGGSVVDVEADPTVVALRAQLKDWTARRDKARAQVACEETGNACPQGTKKSGQGPIYRQRLAEQRDAQGQVDRLQSRLDARLKELSSGAKASREQTLTEANESLPGVQSQLKTLRKIQADEQGAFESANESNTGLLVRLKALSRASEGDFTLAMWRILLFLLITTIECLPIFVKVLQLYAPRTTYETLAEADARSRIQHGELRDQSTALEQTSHLAQAEALASARTDAAGQISRLTADAEVRVAAAILAAWEAREIANIPTHLDEYLTSTTGYPPPAPAPTPAPFEAPPFEAAPNGGAAAPAAFGLPIGGVTPYYAPAYDENARRADFS
ncbi:hypothetical protein GCM10027589_48630 [Actinocorallia lasiicapitis]